MVDQYYSIRADLKNKNSDSEQILPQRLVRDLFLYINEEIQIKETYPVITAIKKSNYVLSCPWEQKLSCNKVKENVV